MCIKVRRFLSVTKDLYTEEGRHLCSQGTVKWTTWPLKLCSTETDCQIGLKFVKSKSCASSLHCSKYFNRQLMLACVMWVVILFWWLVILLVISISIFSVRQSGQLVYQKAILYKYDKCLKLNARDKRYLLHWLCSHKLEDTDVDVITILDVYMLR